MTSASNTQFPVTLATAPPLSSLPLQADSVDWGGWGVGVTYVARRAGPSTAVAELGFMSTSLRERPPPRPLAPRLPREGRRRSLTRRLSERPRRPESLDPRPRTESGRDQDKDRDKERPGQEEMGRDENRYRPQQGQMGRDQDTKKR